MTLRLRPRLKPSLTGLDSVLHLFKYVGTVSVGGVTVDADAERALLQGGGQADLLERLAACLEAAGRPHGHTHPVSPQLVHRVDGVAVVEAQGERVAQPVAVGGTFFGLARGPAFGPAFGLA